MGERCGCGDNVPMGGSDHCPECGCEEYEGGCTVEQAAATFAAVMAGVANFTTPEDM